MKKVEALTAEAVAKGVLTRGRGARRSCGTSPRTADWGPLAGCDLAIEAVVEREDVKRDGVPRTRGTARRRRPCWRRTRRRCRSRGSPTPTPHPERVAGLHFFNPVHRMPLVEVVRGKATDDATVATLVELVRKLGKVPVVVADGPGFLVNRILFPYLDEAVRLVIEGVPGEEVDARRGAVRHADGAARTARPGRHRHRRGRGQDVRGSSRRDPGPTPGAVRRDGGATGRSARKPAAGSTSTATATAASRPAGRRRRHDAAPVPAAASRRVDRGAEAADLPDDQRGREVPGRGRRARGVGGRPGDGAGHGVRPVPRRPAPHRRRARRRPRGPRAGRPPPPARRAVRAGRAPPDEGRRGPRVLPRNEPRTREHEEVHR